LAQAHLSAAAMGVERKLKRTRDVVSPAGSESDGEKGTKVSKVRDSQPVKVLVAGQETEPALAETFETAGLTEKLAQLCLSKFRGGAPTKIQAVAWPFLMEGKDMIGVAKTGSGKTLAFLMPFLARSETKQMPKRKVAWAPRMVVMAPTRELTQQIASVAEEFASPFVKKGVKRYPVVTILGGMPKQEQRKACEDVDIACCTPGRLLDLAEEEALDLGQTQVLVLDEADRMLDMGFIPSVRQIVAKMPKQRQTVLFSATWPPSVEALGAELTNAKQLVHVTVGSAGEVPKANEKIRQEVEMQGSKGKWPRLMQLLKGSDSKKTIIFGLYKKETAWIAQSLKQQGYQIGCLHGDMTQVARSDAIERFRRNEFPMLIATDVAGRGLDVDDVELVVNYTFPLTIEDYVHRIGRTGRAGKNGRAVTFFDKDGGCGPQKESELAEALVKTVEEAGQTVPAALKELAQSSCGSKATKKKAHALYGSHFKDAAEMAKLEAQKTHTTFDDSDDE